MTLQQRADAFAAAFPKIPAAWPRIVHEGGKPVMYATWVLGADYRTRSTFYGAYPHGYLPRVSALFPDIVGSFRWNTLHVFAGSLPESPDYVRADLVQPAEIQSNVYDLPAVYEAAGGVGVTRPRLVLADPPYSAADAVHYGTPMVNRGKATRALAQVVDPGGFLVWLDTVWPMHRKAEWRTVGRILLQRSTNHRARIVSIFERVATC